MAARDCTREASFWKGLDACIQCTLCHQQCRIRPGKRGLCGVRENKSGRLMTLVYGCLLAANVDPIEKKPFNHFMPASLAYSIATAGCNFRCLHCQNADISQMPRETGRIAGNYVPPQEVVAEALQNQCQSVAYTYTEPTIFFEYARDVAALAGEAGLKNVFVSNGYMGQEAAEEILPLLDAINVDLKGDDQFYRKVCGAKREPVEQNIRLFWEAGVWVEVTTLIIPGYNDGEEQLKGIADFLAGISTDIPWHVSAFYPTYKLKMVPRTKAEALRRGLEIGRQAGLKFVYEGNIPGQGENTSCPACHQLLVERSGFRILKNSIVDCRCPKCGTAIAGIWS